MSTMTTQRIETTNKPSEAEIRALAFDLYKKEGGGDPMQHWLKAEGILKGRNAEASPAPRGYAPSKQSAPAKPSQPPAAKRTGRF